MDNVATIPELLSQPNILLDTLEVSGLPPSVDAEWLKLYFESSRLGSHSDAVETCFIVVPGTAHIKFKSSKGTQYIYIYHRSENFHIYVEKFCVKFLRYLLICKILIVDSYNMDEQLTEAFLAFSLLPGIGRARFAGYIYICACMYVYHNNVIYKVNFLFLVFMLV